MPLKANISGTWRDLTPSIKIGTEWKSPDKIYFYTGTIWQEIWEKTMPKNWSVIASAGALTNKTRLAGIGGSYNAALAASGYDGGYSTTAGKFNGTAWTSIASLNTEGRYPSTSQPGFGTSTNAIVTGLGSEFEATEYYNNSTWSVISYVDESHVLNGQYNGCSCGTSYSTGLFTGGRYYRKTIKFNGTVWSNANSDLLATTYNAAMAGSQTSALFIGGAGCTVFQYNGTVWDYASNYLSSAIQQNSAFGTSASSITSCGGNNYSEEYNGTSWMLTGKLNTSRYQFGTAGTTTAGLAFGGGTSGYSTEKYE